MRRTILLSTLILAAAVACGDDAITSSAPVSKAQPADTQPPAMQSISGSLVVDEQLINGGVVLQVGASQEIRIVGNVQLLRHLRGADVVLYGLWNSPEVFQAFDFQVYGMNGQVAYDGVLESTDGAYTLHMRDGTMKPIEDAPAGLLAYSGLRVWISLQPETNTPAQFGLIDLIDPVF